MPERVGDVPVQAAHAGVSGARTLRAHDVDVLFTLNGGHLFPLYDGCVQEQRQPHASP